MKGNLLVVSPNYRSSIRNQTISISPFFDRVNVLVPQPYFPRFLLGVSFFRNSLLFLDDVVETGEASKVRREAINVVRPRFFTLPIETVRRRVPLLVARSSINALKRGNIQFNLVHAHRLDIGFTGAILKDMRGDPLIITCHGSDAYDFPFRDDFCHAIARYTLDRADHVIAVCKSDAEKLFSIGLPFNRLSVIPNGIDDSRFHPIPQQLARETLKLPLNKKIILSVGTLHEVKGHAYLIDAMHLISKVSDDILAIIVGAGPLQTKLTKKIEMFGLEQMVLLVGWKPHDSIPLWMNASDVFVLPSLNEGFPNVIPEAMACGKPVIGSRVGGIPDAISADNVGILVNPRDSESLAQGILEALNRSWKPEEIRSCAKKYSSENVAEQILQAYRRVAHF